MIYDEMYDEYSGEIPDSFYGGLLPMRLRHDGIVCDNHIGWDKDPTRLPNVIDITNADEQTVYLYDEPDDVYGQAKLWWTAE